MTNASIDSPSQNFGHTQKSRRILNYDLNTNQNNMNTPGGTLNLA